MNYEHEGGGNVSLFTTFVTIINSSEHRWDINCNAKILNHYRYCNLYSHLTFLFPINKIQINVYRNTMR